MATLEKFKYYKSLFLRYRKIRFGLLKFAGLSVLIVMLGITTRPDWIVLSGNFVFVFVSLFVFRWIDDAWSFYNDRIEHPDRFYILPAYFKSFVMLGLLMYVFYLSALFLSSFSLVQTMLILFIISTVFYSIFFKNKYVRSLIPILKYPVIIWCISDFSMSGEVQYLAFGSFFMMIAFDYFQENQSGRKGILVKLALLTVTGLMVFQPWAEKDNLLPDVGLVIVPLLFLFIIPGKALPFFPIIFYPLVHVFDVLL
jgi:hypothetical protein